MVVLSFRGTTTDIHLSSSTDKALPPEDLLDNIDLLYTLTVFVRNRKVYLKLALTWSVHHNGSGTRHSGT
jgi:hypothetical protein